MYKINLDNPINIFFIGIGGISMSGLAKILKNRGFYVTGSDRDQSEQTEDLKKQGIKVILGQKAENITKDFDLVVYTAAISEDNPELVAAKNLGVPLITRAQLLGAIMENFKESITVSGTHGKTTSTAMISEILLEYTNPTVTIGGVLPKIGGNICMGDSEYFVAEACEYTNSFFSFYPKYSLILNIEEDHPDFFKDLYDIRNSFKHFANNTKSGGHIFINTCIENLSEIVEVPNVSVTTFGFSKEADYTASNIVSSKGKTDFDVIHNEKVLGRITLFVPGRCNVENALGVISVCNEIGIPFSYIKKGLSEFTGTHRRFEKIGTLNGASVISDYAHHPTEINACISQAREFNPKRLVVLFQPHTYSRTKQYLDDFVKALSGADLVLLDEIYAAREQNIHNISSASIAEKLKESSVCAEFFESKDMIQKYLKKNILHDDLLIIMGAGDIYLIANPLLEK